MEGLSGLQGLSAIHPQGIVGVPKGGLSENGRAAMEELKRRGYSAANVAWEVAKRESPALQIATGTEGSLSKLASTDFLSGTPDEIMSGLGSFIGVGSTKSIPVGSKATNLNYISRSIELGSENPGKYKTLISHADDGSINGAAAVYPSRDSLVIETIGGVGGGGKVLRKAVDESIEKGYNGAISLAPVRDAKTIDWYVNHGFDIHPSNPNMLLLTPEESSKLLNR